MYYSNANKSQELERHFPQNSDICGSFSCTLCTIREFYLDLSFVVEVATLVPQNIAFDFLIVLTDIRSPYTPSLLSVKLAEILTSKKFQDYLHAFFTCSMNSELSLAMSTSIFIKGRD